MNRDALTIKILDLVSKPRVSGLEQVVVRVIYEAIVASDKDMAKTHGHVDLTPPDPACFVPYDDLTQDQVMAWIEPSIDRQDLARCLQQELDNRDPDNKTVSFAIPWQNQYNYDVNWLYVLEKNGEVLWGLDHWHSDAINAALQDKCIAARVPDDHVAYTLGIVPINEPLVIDDDTRVHRVSHPVRPEHNELLYSIVPPLIIDFNSVPAQVSYSTEPKPLPEAKKLMIDFLHHQHRTVLEQGRAVSTAEQKFTVSLRTMDYLMLMSRDGDTLPYVFDIDGICRRISKTDRGSIKQQINDFWSGLDTWHYAWQEKILSSQTIQELEEIFEDLKDIGHAATHPA